MTFFSYKEHILFIFFMKTMSIGICPPAQHKCDVVFEASHCQRHKWLRNTQLGGHVVSYQISPIQLAERDSPLSHTFSKRKILGSFQDIK